MEGKLLRKKFLIHKLFAKCPKDNEPTIPTTPTTPATPTKAAAPTIKEALAAPTIFKKVIRSTACEPKKVNIEAKSEKKKAVKSADYLSKKCKCKPSKRSLPIGFFTRNLFKLSILYIAASIIYDIMPPD